MTVDVDRIPALHLSLSDMVWDHHPQQQRWVRIVGLALDDDHVIVTCEGDDQVIGIPAQALVAVRRPGPLGPPGDDAEVHETMSGWYPGDMASASAAVSAHAQRSAVRPAPTKASPIAHYEGLYGGDLDHIVDAIGGVPDAETRDLRAAATRRHLAEGQQEPSDGDASETDDDGTDNQADWYVGDVGYIVDNRDK
jgi:hypothetical protein